MGLVLLVPLEVELICDVELLLDVEFIDVLFEIIVAFVDVWLTEMGFVPFEV